MYKKTFSLCKIGYSVFLTPFATPQRSSGTPRPPAQNTRGRDLQPSGLTTMVLDICNMSPCSNPVLHVQDYFFTPINISACWLNKIKMGWSKKGRLFCAML